MNFKDLSIEEKEVVIKQALIDGTLENVLEGYKHTIFCQNQEIAVNEGFDTIFTYPISLSLQQDLNNKFFSFVFFPKEISAVYWPMSRKLKFASPGEIYWTVEDDNLKKIEDFGIESSHEVVLYKKIKHQYVAKLKESQEVTYKSLYEKHLSPHDFAYLDTETSGMDTKTQQILEYALVLSSSQGIEKKSLEIKIKLRPGVVPDPGALAANNIDPTTPEWQASAFFEDDAAKMLVSFVKNECKGLKPYFVAYNASFDKRFIESLLNKVGVSFEEVFEGVFDPLKVSRALTRQKKLKTKWNAERKFYSHTLGDVSEALNIKPQGELHRAITDVRLLKEVTVKLVQLLIN